MKTLNLTFAFIIILTFAFTTNASTFNTLNTNQTKIKVTTGRMTKIMDTQTDCTYKVEGTVTEKIIF